jgi:hypothetical protein
MLGMAQQIRIAIDLDQQAEKGVPVKVKFLTPEGKTVDVFASIFDKEPTEQPITIDGEEGGRVFTEDGGKFAAHFWWTASDKKERDFQQDFDIPVPPECPKCLQRVPEIPKGEYICHRCRFGF